MHKMLQPALAVSRKVLTLPKLTWHRESVRASQNPMRYACALQHAEVAGSHFAEARVRRPLPVLDNRAGGLNFA